MESEWQEAAEHAARLGGEILQDWAGRFTVSEKSRSNLVTEADFASQEAIAGYLHDRFPEHGFLGEEGLSKTYDESCPYRWVIDPLDGTSNYVHGFPYYGVSIALEKQVPGGLGEMVVGVVFDPTRDEMFSASASTATTLNGRPVQPSESERLSEAMAVASLPVATTPHDRPVLRFLNVLPKAQSLQRTGSAALNLCYVASGRIDGFWSTSLKPWDMAAGILLVQRAGGRVTTCNGRDPVNVDVADMLATNGTALHAELAACLD